jgi:hypothetical protein
LLTAVNADAPPILQWDSEEERNPVSWYLWHGGSSASQWGLVAGKWEPVVAITLKPSMWHNVDNEHQGKGAILILQDAHESHAFRAGLGLFPEIMRRELREIRATIEAYSKAGTLTGEKEGACGLMLDAGNRTWDDTVVRVTTGGQELLYKLDRWD